MSTLASVIQRGTRASQPVATTVPVGTLYFVTDEFVIERSSGSAWQAWSAVVMVGDTGSGGARGLVPRPATGDATKFLRGDATWATPASAAAGALIFREEKIASASAALNFTGWYNSLYDNYLITFTSLVMSNNTAEVRLQVSVDAGANYLATGYLTQIALFRMGAVTQVNIGYTTSVVLADSYGTGVTRNALSGKLFFSNPVSTLNRVVTYDVVTPSSDGNWYMNRGGSVINNASPVDAFRIIPSAGTITSGVVRIYGVAKL